MQPVIARRVHRDLAAAALVDQHLPHRGALGQRLVHDRLQANLAAAAIRGVLRNDRRTLRIVDAIDQRLRGESAEDHRVHRANARTREQRDRQLGTHAHVDGDAVALLHAERLLQHIREGLDLRMQLAVGEPPNLAGLALPQQRDLILARAERMPVHAVVREVQLAVDEPLRPRPLAHQHLAPRREPVQFAGRLAPETLGIFDAAPVERLVLLQSLYMGLGHELRRGSEDAILAQTRFQIRTLFHHAHPVPPSISFQKGTLNERKTAN
jgi:hypothetical protein